MGVGEAEGMTMYQMYYSPSRAIRGSRLISHPCGDKPPKDNLSNGIITEHCRCGEYFWVNPQLGRYYHVCEHQRLWTILAAEQCNTTWVGGTFWTWALTRLIVLSHCQLRGDLLWVADVSSSGSWYTGRTTIANLSKSTHSVIQERKTYSACENTGPRL